MASPKRIEPVADWARLGVIATLIQRRLERLEHAVTCLAAGTPGATEVQRLALQEIREEQGEVESDSRSLFC